MFNSHVHSNFSHDCNTSMEKMCESAIRSGLLGICVTDHFNADSCITQNSYRSVLNSVKKARELSLKYEGKLLITAGVEMSDVFRKPEYSARLVKAACPDSIIMSVHNVVPDNLPENIARMRFSDMSQKKVNEVISVYFKELIEAVTLTDFDICAHLTLPYRYINGVYGLSLSYEEFLPEIKKILSILIDRNKALEINTSDVHRQLYDFMPDEKIVRMYYEMGGRLVTIGTDAHHPHNISSGFKEAKEMLLKIGFKSYCYYKNRKSIEIIL